MAGRLRGLLFDKDGTLFDFTATYGPALARLLGELTEDGAMADRLARAVGFERSTERFAPDSVVIAGTAADIAAAFAPLLDEPDSDGLRRRIDEGFDRLTRETATLLPGIEDALAALEAAGYALGLATNDAERNARSHLEATGLIGRFGFIAGYDSGHGAKPGSGMALAFARHLGVAPQAVAMVGDSLRDMACGRGAGALCVAVTTGPATAAELAPQADHVIGGVTALPALLASLA